MSESRMNDRTRLSEITAIGRGRCTRFFFPSREKEYQSADLRGNPRGSPRFHDQRALIRMQEKMMSLSLSSNYCRRLLFGRYLGRFHKEGSTARRSDKKEIYSTGGDSDARLVSSRVRAEEEGDRISETAHRAECH